MASSDQSARRDRVRKKRTQEERSAATQDLLTQATIDAAHEAGLARLTTADVAKRAGVSRGALMHHYDSKDDLIAVAYERLLSEATQEIRSWLDMARAREMTLETFLDKLWIMYSGRLIFVTLEHITEARHNEPLRQKFIPIVRQFHAALEACWREFFHETGTGTADPTTVLTMTTALYRGIGFQKVLSDDTAYFENLVQHWKIHVLSLVEVEAEGTKPGLRQASSPLNRVKSTNGPGQAAFPSPDTGSAK